MIVSRCFFNSLNAIAIRETLGKEQSLQSTPLQYICCKSCSEYWAHASEKYQPTAFHRSQTIQQLRSELQRNAAY